MFTSTKKRLERFTKTPGMLPSTVFSKKKLSTGSINRVTGDLADRLETFRSKTLQTPAEVDSMVSEIKEAERHEIAYNNKYADRRRQNQTSNLRDIMEDLLECQRSIDLLEIKKNFVPRYLGRRGDDVAKYLKYEKNLRRRNTRCRTVLQSVLREKQRRELELTGNITRGLEGRGSNKKRRTGRRASRRTGRRASRRTGRRASRRTGRRAARRTGRRAARRTGRRAARTKRNPRR